MNCLRVERLNFERDDVPILHDVDLELNAGEVVQLAGHNGSGKTTLMRIMAGLISPSSGNVLWNGQVVSGFEFKSSLLFLGHQIGVKQTMTPLENLQWYFGLNGIKKPCGAQEPDEAVSDAKLHTALNEVNIGLYADIPCHQLSAGQQRRVALARLFLSRAPIWMLDEPFTAIDKSGVAKLEAQIDKHAERGGIVILTTHQLWRSEKIRVVDVSHFKPSRSRDQDL